MGKGYHMGQESLQYDTITDWPVELVRAKRIALVEEAKFGARCFKVKNIRNVKAFRYKCSQKFA